MFAVIRTGGKQYRVTNGDVIRVEKLPGVAGARIELAEVLAMGEGADARLGTPLIDGAAVAATIVEQAKADKILIFKRKRRQNYRRLRGHRQRLTVLRITDIYAPGAERPAVAAAETAPAAAQPATTPARPRKTVAGKTAAKQKD